MSKYHFDAVIFDLDGVITKTAIVHSHAWKKMFDDYLRYREKKYGEVFHKFTQNEYLTYVDGKPRYDGVNSFLASRQINLPYGTPEDIPGKETVCGLGNKKNLAFNKVLEKEGVEVYPATVALMKKLRENNIHVGVASSSKNCKAVLEAAHLTHLVETRIDGVVAAEMGLQGKPAPDIFIATANNLGVKPYKTVVVEDASSGVAAGKNGNFGYVLGIAREKNYRNLKINGADEVVFDLEETSIEKIEQWFASGLEKSNYEIAYFDYNPKNEHSREALLTIGNGYFGTRGALEETEINTVNYPGTYIAGVYNKLTTKIAGKEVINEDLVNCPNWLPIRFKVNDGMWADPNQMEIIDIERHLNFKTGLLSKKLVLKDDEGNITEIESYRFASMNNMHIAGIKYKITPVNYSGLVTISSILNGALENKGVERYKLLNSKHLEPVEQGGQGAISYVKVKTCNSDIEIAEAAKLIIPDDDISNIEINVEEGMSISFFEKYLKKKQPFTFEKLITIYTSREDENPLMTALENVKPLTDFDTLFEYSTKAWEKIWGEIDIHVIGNRLSQKLLHMHLYHVIVSASPHNTNIDAGITARGLHGEAYRGHIFWDELFVLPFYDIHFPKTAHSLLLYRYRRLNKARKYAKQYGYKGAMFPWQSGSDGSEQTQTLHLNPVSGKWGDDMSSLQRHVSLAVAYNVWLYVHITNDISFLEDYGMEIIIEICRFWESKTTWDSATKRFSIDKIMGPDEFHEKYPNATEGGLKDNAYTNIMVAWLFKTTGNLISKISTKTKNNLYNKIKFQEEEIDTWNNIRRHLRLVISNEGIIAQYDGYFNLKELDWDFYRKKYGNVYRMDRLLKAEGKSADEYKVAKQADMLMVFYNLDKKAVDGLLMDMGYKLPDDYLEKNLKYYLALTSHGSTLSRVVHAQLSEMAGNKRLGYDLYMDALKSDFKDIQGGTTAEGIHTGVMAGTVFIAITTFGGINLKNEILHVNPKLPLDWEKMSFALTFKNIKYNFEITGKQLKVKVNANTQIVVNGKNIILNKENTVILL